MNLNMFQREHLSWCQKLGMRSCHLDKRDLNSDTCAHCVVKFLNARSKMEKFNIDDNTSLVPAIEPLYDDRVVSGLVVLKNVIRTGGAITQYPVGSRLVIRDTVWEVVGHDTISVTGKPHTMTLRLFSDNYLDKIYSGISKTHEWDQSTLRNFLNSYYLTNVTCAPLREMVLSVINTQYQCKWHEAGCTCGCESTERALRKIAVTCVDKVWIPSDSQLGMSADDTEGTVLNAFDPSFSVASTDNRIVAEKIGDSIIPKKYWTRSAIMSGNQAGTHQIDWNGDLVVETNAEEAAAMVVPFITIG